MSLPAPLRPLRRRAPEPAPAQTRPQEWHVGLSMQGMFPHHEASCPCAKAPCGLAIPRADTFCQVHQTQVLAFRQLHTESECRYPRRGWFRRRRAGR